MTPSSSLRGPSAEALSVLEKQLGSDLGDVGSRKASEVGTNLFELARVLRQEPRLRRALTDVSADPSAKAELATALFSGKVDDIATGLVAKAAEQRWTATHDLPDVLERLGVERLVRSAEDPGRIADELFAVERMLHSAPELRIALADPARSVADKQGLLESLLSGKTLAATARLVELAVSGSHRTVGLALADYQRIAASVQDGRVATVRTARQLTDAEVRRLEAALKRQYHRTVHLNMVVEPDLIGGLRIEIGDDVIDGSVANRLDDARRRLVG
jgi:F-type H+-transporting ATPase subunit delta